LEEYKEKKKSDKKRKMNIDIGDLIEKNKK